MRLIRDGDTVATGGFAGVGSAVALEECCLAGHGPRGPAQVCAGRQGKGRDKGLNHLAPEGLVRHVIGIC